MPNCSKIRCVDKDICVILTVTGCPNSCFQQGTCVGGKCVCDKGWKGNSCEQYTCEELNNCGFGGYCAGPNICRCYQGWRVRMIHITSRITMILLSIDYVVTL